MLQSTIQDRDLDGVLWQVSLQECFESVEEKFNNQLHYEERQHGSKKRRMVLEIIN